MTGIIIVARPTGGWWPAPLTIPRARRVPDGHVAQPRAIAQRGSGPPDWLVNLERIDHRKERAGDGEDIGAAQPREPARVGQLRLTAAHRRIDSGHHANRRRAAHTDDTNAGYK